MLNDTATSQAIRSRAIRPGETIPTGVPQRIITNRGYVRLRWNVGGGLRLEIFEHRMVVGNPPDVDVHHKNGVKTDNRRENLDVLPHADHSRVHNQPTVDAGLVVAGYVAGETTVALAQRFGIHHTNIRGLLLRRGIAMRDNSDYRTTVDLDALRALYTEGQSVTQMARTLGVGNQVVRHRMKELGLPPRPAGRPRKSAA